MSAPSQIPGPALAGAADPQELWRADPLDWLRGVAQAAAAAGFAGIALMDHLIQIPQVDRAWEPIPEPWVTLGMLAGLDTRLRLGTLVSPATFRRGIPLRRLGRRLNPFPLVQLPYHRMVNPWTMGAILHEVSHNLQNDLHLQVAVPRSVLERLRAAGLPEAVCRVWARWNREVRCSSSITSSAWPSSRRRRSARSPADCPSWP